MPYDLRRNTNPGRRMVRPMEDDTIRRTAEDADMPGPSRARAARTARRRRPVVEELSADDLNGMVLGQLGRPEEDTARSVPAALARERIRQTMGLKKGGQVSAKKPAKKATPKKKASR